jgi:hypothetical protein
MIEGDGPESASAGNREFLREFLPVKSQPPTGPVLIVDLQVADLMQQHVVEHKSPHSERRPLLSEFGPEFRGRNSVAPA